MTFHKKRGQHRQRQLQQPHQHPLQQQQQLTHHQRPQNTTSSSNRFSLTSCPRIAANRSIATSPVAAGVSTTPSSPTPTFKPMSWRSYITTTSCTPPAKPCRPRGSTTLPPFASVLRSQSLDRNVLQPRAHTTPPCAQHTTQI